MVISIYSIWSLIGFGFSQVNSGEAVLIGNENSILSGISNLNILSAISEGKITFGQSGSLIYVINFLDEFNLQSLNGINVTIHSGTTITSLDGNSLDVSAFGITAISDSNNLSVFDFGITGNHLIFNKPIQIDVPSNLGEGTLVNIEVLHAGSQNYGTQGLTNNAFAACNTGVSSDENNTSIVANGIIKVLTCGASNFRLNLLNIDEVIATGVNGEIANTSSGAVMHDGEGNIISTSEVGFYGATAIQSEYNQFIGESIVGGAKLGVSGKRIIPSHPVTVTIPVSVANGTIVTIRSKRLGDGYFNIKTSTAAPANANFCLEGNDGSFDIMTTSGIGNNQVIVQSGKVIFQTCELSDFTVLTGDTVCSNPLLTIPVSECEALNSIFTNLDGQNWINKSGRGVNPDVSQWHGIVLNSNTPKHVSSLLMHRSDTTIIDYPSDTSKNGNGISGVIAPEIGDLTELQQLSILQARDNLTPIPGRTLKGPIPVSISKLSKLRYLNLSRTNLTTLPSEIQLLTGLSYFVLNYSDALRGEQKFPTRFQNMSGLESLIITDNTDLTQTGIQVLPSEWSQIPNLKHLSVSSAIISGTIPTSWRNMTKLESLTLTNLKNTDQIPVWLCELTGLTSINFRDSNFDGTIPECFYNMPNLKFIDLSRNKLIGEISTGLIYSTITHYNVSYNNLTGSIPMGLTGTYGKYFVDRNRLDITTLPESYRLQLDLIAPQRIIQNSLFPFDLLSIYSNNQALGYREARVGNNVTIDFIPKVLQNSLPSVIIGNQTGTVIPRGISGYRATITSNSDNLQGYLVGQITLDDINGVNTHRIQPYINSVSSLTYNGTTPTIDLFSGNDIYKSSETQYVFVGPRIPVDLAKNYTIFGKFRSAGSSNTRFFFGVQSFKSDGSLIQQKQYFRQGNPQTILSYTSGSITTNQILGATDYNLIVERPYAKYIGFYYDGNTQRLPDFVLEGPTNIVSVSGGAYYGISGNQILLNSIIPQSEQAKIILGVTKILNHGDGAFNGTYGYPVAEDQFIPTYRQDYMGPLFGVGGGNNQLKFETATIRPFMSFFGGPTEFDDVFVFDTSTKAVTTTDGSYVNFYSTSQPILSNITMVSNNINSGYSTSGNIITIKFYSNKPISSYGTINGHSATITPIGLGPDYYVATANLTSQDIQGPVNFELIATDAEGARAIATGLAIGNPVIHDSIAPTITTVLDYPQIIGSKSLNVTINSNENVSLSIGGSNNCKDLTFVSTGTSGGIQILLSGLNEGDEYRCILKAADIAGNITNHDLIPFTHHISPYGVCNGQNLTIPQTECEALMKIYNNTIGTNRLDNSNWGISGNVASWFGVGISGGHVIEIILSGNNLVGSNFSISGLESLSKLDLSNNQLQGSIPVGSNLKSLNLSSNLYSGELYYLSNSINLEELNLSLNYFNRDNNNKAILQSGFSIRLSGISGNIENQKDTVSPIILSIGEIPEILTGNIFTGNIDIIENSYATGLGSSGINVLITGNIQCGQIKASILTQHIGSQELVLTIESGVYIGCYIALQDRAGNMSVRQGLNSFTVTGTVNTGTVNTGTVNTGTVNTGTVNTGTVNTGTVNTGTVNTGTVNTGTVNTGTVNTESNGGQYVSSLISVALNKLSDILLNIGESNIATGRNHQVAGCEIEGFNDSEMNNAYQYVCSKGITNKQTLKDINIDGELTRRDLAKIVTVFSKTLAKTFTGQGICEFSDLKSEDHESKEYITESCKLGLMGYNSDGITSLRLFEPGEKVTRAQFATIMSRMLFGTKFATKKDERFWYKKHVSALHDRKILLQTNRLDAIEKRGFAFIVLMRIANMIGSVSL